MMKNASVQINPPLSIRLQMAADLLQEALSSDPRKDFTDIGTDHAYLPIAMVQNGIVQTAAAADVRTGPLETARRHIKACGLENCIETRLSDGLDQFLPEELHAVVMAGMGGFLICDLCRRASAEGRLAACQSLILQPQSDIREVRRMLYEIGYSITREAMCFDRGKYYIAFLAVRDENPGLPDEAAYSSALFQERSSCFLNFLHAEIDKNLRILETITRSQHNTDPDSGTEEKIRKLQYKVASAREMIASW